MDTDQADKDLLKKSVFISVYQWFLQNILSYTMVELSMANPGLSKAPRLDIAYYPAEEVVFTAQDGCTVVSLSTHTI